MPPPAAMQHPPADLCLPEAKLMNLRHLLPLLLAPAVVMPATASDYAHPPIQIKKKEIKAGTGKDAVKIEDVTAHGLECHGSDIGAAETDAEAPTPAHSVGPSGRSHPVEVVYPESAEGLTPRGGLDGILLLIEGKVTCITCHDPGAPDHSLVISQSGSQLCLACHQR